MTEPAPIKLLTWRGTCDGCDALLRAAGKHAAGMVGFVYAPSAPPRFFRIDAAGVQPDPDGKPFPIETAYEARLFDGKRDIRSRRDGNRWRIAVVSDESVAGTGSDSLAGEVGLTPGGDLPVCDWRDHQYLLWGRKPRSEPERNGWTRLTAARIGALWVPYRLEGGQDGIVITAREYFRTADDGNVVLAGERLTGLGGVSRGDARAKEAGHAG
jgi:CRISPR-associated protein (TIGR03984 family)